MKLVKYLYNFVCIALNEAKTCYSDDFDKFIGYTAILFSIIGVCVGATFGVLNNLSILGIIAVVFFSGVFSAVFGAALVFFSVFYTEVVRRSTKMFLSSLSKIHKKAKGK